MNESIVFFDDTDLPRADDNEPGQEEQLRDED